MTGCTGCTVSTVKLATGGDGSMLPAWSVPDTEIVCGPSASGPKSAGDVQGAGTSESTWQTKVTAVASVAWNSSVGVLSPVVPEGAESITVTGGVASIVKSMSELVVGFPAGSVAVMVAV